MYLYDYGTPRCGRSDKQVHEPERDDHEEGRDADPPDGEGRERHRVSRPRRRVETTLPPREERAIAQAVLPEDRYRGPGRTAAAFFPSAA